MRRIALTVVIASTLAWAGATAMGVVGCSSDPPKASADAGSKKLSSSSSGDDDDDSTNTSSGNTSSSSGSTSSSGGTDGGNEAGSTSSGGALGSNPLKITCKPNDCTTDGEGAGACCWPGGKQDTAKCAPAGDTCDPDNDFNVSCDEKADCKAGVCCWGDGQSLCADKCADVDKPGDNPGQPDIQLCKTDAECGAEKCTKKTCGFGAEGTADADLIKVTISVCGAPANCK